MEENDEYLLGDEVENIPSRRDPNEEHRIQEGIEEQEDERLRRRVRSQQVWQLLEEHLAERERKVMTLLYGLDGGEEMTEAEVGKLLGLNENQVEKMRDEAVEKLVDSALGERLGYFWTG